MKLENVDGYTFDFSDALNAFVFDEKDTSKPTWHGLPMKAVDILVELKDAYLLLKLSNMMISMNSILYWPLMKKNKKSDEMVLNG